MAAASRADWASLAPWSPILQQPISWPMADIIAYLRTVPPLQ
jgi:hypothetical protein